MHGTKMQWAISWSWPEIVFLIVQVKHQELAMIQKNYENYISRDMFAPPGQDELITELAQIWYPLVNWNWGYSPETLNSGKNRRFFVLCDLEIWWMTLENNRAPLLCYIKLCASFQIHRWIQIGVTVWKRSIWVKIGNFLSRVTLKFLWMTSNKANLRDLIAVTGLAILLKLDSNRQFFALVTLKFDGWPRKIIRHVFYTTSCWALICVSFQIHQEIQTEDTVLKRQIWVKIDDFF